MRPLFERIGGADVVAATVDGFYERLTQDPRVRHHFDPGRMEQLKSAQRRWFTSVLGGPVEGELPNLTAAHADLDITDEQVKVVLQHLDDSLADAEVEPNLREPVLSLVSRLWHARVF
jgi:hemoglobin